MKSSILKLVALFLVSCGTYEEEKKTPYGLIQTSYGDMVFEFYDETPLHRKSFLHLAENKYWDSLTFNRVIKDFVIQGGCPDTPEGFDSTHYLIKPEFYSEIKHMYGAVGMGRDNNPEKLSAGCQFYIVNKKEGLPFLNDNYTVFGKLISGFDVLDSISNVQTDSLDQPIESIQMKVKILKQ